MLPDSLWLRIAKCVPPGILYAPLPATKADNTPFYGGESFLYRRWSAYSRGREDVSRGLLYTFYPGESTFFNTAWDRSGRGP